MTTKRINYTMVPVVDDSFGTANVLYRFILFSVCLCLFYVLLSRISRLMEVSM